MAVELNHHIVYAHDAKASSAFVAEMLGLASPREWGPFHIVEMANGVSLDYMQTDDFGVSHYAFLVSESEFDEIFGRIVDRGLKYFADPHGSQPGEINHNDGGRGVYWPDPDGHLLEIITRPYGST